MRPMGSTQLVDDVRDVNQSWLVALQMAAAKDSASACALYNISEDVCSYIARCSYSDLKRIAEYPYSIARFELTTSNLDRLLGCPSALMPLQVLPSAGKPEILQ